MKNILIFVLLSITTLSCSNKKVKLIYEKNGEISSPCNIDKVLDFIIPEKVCMKVGTTLFRYSGNTFENSKSWVIKTAYNNKNNLNEFVAPYSKTSPLLMSGVWGQLHGYSTTYIQYPKNTTNKLVIFCHGYAGNWKMYQGILSNLEGSVVISIGTSNINGIYSKNDLQKIFDIYIPYLKKEGYDVKELHIIGLSNGGTAISNAIKYYPSKFKSYTVISSNLAGIYKTKGSINFIGGQKDNSANKIKSQHQKCLNMGIKSVLYNPYGDHFLLVTKTNEIIHILNKIIN